MKIDEYVKNNVFRAPLSANIEELKIITAAIETATPEIL